MKEILNKIKNFLYQNWYLITFAITVLTDLSNGILESLELNQKTIILIRFIGMIVLAYKFKTRKKNENV